MRKTFLLGGLVLFCAGTALAGQRTRADAMRDGGVSSDSIKNVREIAPGVATGEVDGVQLSVSADGSVVLSDVIESHGTTGAYVRELLLSQVASAPGEVSGRMYANGATMNTRDSYGDAAPASTVEEYKEDMQWVAETVDGANLIVFANGVVMKQMTNDMPQPARADVPSAVYKDTKVFADGVVVFEE
jgi:hypothetical protein